MTAVGAMCVALTIVAICSAARRGSLVERRLALFAPAVRRSPPWRPVSDRDLRQGALMRSQTRRAGQRPSATGAWIVPMGTP